jgi:hypothetical protein
LKHRDGIGGYIARTPRHGRLIADIISSQALWFNTETGKVRLDAIKQIVQRQNQTRLRIDKYRLETRHRPISGRWRQWNGDQAGVQASEKSLNEIQARRIKKKNSFTWLCFLLQTQSQDARALIQLFMVYTKLLFVGDKCIRQIQGIVDSSMAKKLNESDRLEG